MGLLSGNYIPGKKNDPGWLQSRQQRTECGRDFSAFEANDECLAGTAAIGVSLLDFRHAEQNFCFRQKSIDLLLQFRKKIQRFERSHAIQIYTP